MTQRSKLFVVRHNADTFLKLAGAPLVNRIGIAAAVIVVDGVIDVRVGGVRPRKVTVAHLV